MHAVGRKKKPDKLKTVTMTMADEIITAIKTKAGRRKFSAWIRAAVEKELNK